MAQRSYSYADKINDVKVMLAGLTVHSERLGKRGISSEFIANLQSKQENAKIMDNEQEASKARQKEKSKELANVMSDMGKDYSQARKVVKLEMPKESWKEFGIDDER